MSKSERQTQKRAQIIEAAILVFADKGYHSARVADIASEAQVADGTIYLYFKNKEDLLISIFEDKMTMLITELEQALKGCSGPEQMLKVCAQQHFEQIKRYPELAKVLQVELRQSQRFFNDYKPKKLWAYLSIFVNAIEEGQKKGLFRADIPADILSWSFFGSLDELAVQWVLSRKKERFNLHQLPLNLAEIFIRGITLNENLEPL